MLFASLYMNRASTALQHSLQQICIEMLMCQLTGTLYMPLLELGVCKEEVCCVASPVSSETRSKAEDIEAVLNKAGPEDRTARRPVRDDIDTSALLGDLDDRLLVLARSSYELVGRSIAAWLLRCRSSCTWVRKGCTILTSGKSSRWWSMSREPSRLVLSLKFTLLHSCKLFTGACSVYSCTIWHSGRHTRVHS